ncbi:hypothetical protein TNCV_61511 [Trichonephila clavipes]|nr:hypothetical protein TNCV_61511 [Trichonephila clavipes]
MHTSKNISDLVIPQGIVPADEGFNQSSEISCLIGSELFGTKQIRISNSNFRLIDSKFGYVVTGSYIDEPFVLFLKIGTLYAPSGIFLKSNR